jgi:alkaline phosphatase D
VYRKIPYGPLLDVFMLDMRSYRGPNGSVAPGPCGPAARLLGPKQIAWLKRELAASRATWKVIAADLPLGIASGDAIGFGDGPACARELEIADLLSFIKHAGIRNTLWVTADVHYTAAHHYDPVRAQFQDFDPFWEFVSGPIHAGTWWPGDLDNTFGPCVAYQKASTRERGENLPPSFGLQFFGHVAIDGTSRVMTVTLRDVGNTALWSVTLEPRPDTRPGSS